MAQSLADLLEALADPDDATREEAAQALAAQPDPKATQALIEALEDEYWVVRMHAAHALGKISGQVMRVWRFIRLCPYWAAGGPTPDHGSSR